MRLYRTISNLFFMLAAAVAIAMGVIVSCNASNIQWEARYAEFAAPACIAYVLINDIPYLLCAILCLLIAKKFRRCGVPH